MENEELVVGQDAQPTEQDASEVANEATASTSTVEQADPQAPAAEEAAVEKEEQETRPSTLEELKAGMRMQGIVRNVVDFGAFVDIGVGRDGLAHISTLKRAGIDKDLQVGAKIDVQVRRVDLDNNRISLTVPGAGKSDKTAIEDIKAQSIVTGRIVRLVDFGAFVDIGAQTDGLLHISQLPGGFINHPSEVVKVGDEVEVRVLEIDTERRRISLTMKPVQDQGLVQDQDQYESGRPERSSGGQRRRSERSGGGGGRPRGRRQPMVVSTANSNEPAGPTAFEIAWQKALDAQKGGQQ